MSNREGALAGKVALITGATSGLGQHFARLVAREGARVAIAGRRGERLDALADEIKALGGEAFAVVMDVSRSDSILAGLEAVEKGFGTIDILVNNAGIPDAALATKAELDLVDRVFDTNLKAPFILAREVAARLIKEGRPGRIVNISSISAFHCARAGSALYSISKAAVVRMTEVLAVEWAGRNINVNAIAPGTFESEMTEGMIARVGSDFVQSFPRKRLGVPSQLDSSLLYLLSDASEAVTGTILKVDDGQFPR